MKAKTEAETAVRRSTREYFAHLALVVIGVLIVGGGSCFAQPAPATVRWGGIPTVETMTLTYVALTKGFFADEGIKVEGPTLGGGPAIRDAMAAGEIDFFDTGTLNYLVGREKGLSQRIIFETFTAEIFSLFVRSELKDRVKRVRDLKGLKIGVIGAGSANWVAANAYLKNDGLSPKDVDFVFLTSPDPAIWALGFERGTIDAGLVWEPIDSLIRQRHAAFPLVDISDPDTHRRQIGPRASSLVLVTTEKMITEKPQVVRRVVSALKKAANFVATHTSAEVAGAVSRSLKMNQGILESILERRRAYFSKNGAVSRSGLSVEVDLALNAGVLKRRLGFEEMVDSQFAGTEP